MAHSLLPPGIPDLRSQPSAISRVEPPTHTANPKLLEQLGFAPAHVVQGRESIADVFRPKQRCGIYVLKFLNGEAYVGKSVDVTRRYVQHRKIHTDIENLSFKRMAHKHLDAEEHHLIGVLEKEGWSLRNITFISWPNGETDFDLIMPPEDQERWLSDLEWIDLAGSRLINPGFRHRYHNKYERFRGRPHAAQVVEVLRDYVRFGIPAIRRGEVSFWACTCLPAQYVYARIDINWQEVLSAYSYGNEPEFSIHLARSPLEQKFGGSLDHLLRRYPSAVHLDHQYVPGGENQTRFYVPARIARKFITDPDILPAIRQFNLGLMRKGPCTYGRYHCLDLADRLIE